VKNESEARRRMPKYSTHLLKAAQSSKPNALRRAAARLFHGFQTAHSTVTGSTPVGNPHHPAGGANSFSRSAHSNFVPHRPDPSTGITF